MAFCGKIYVFEVKWIQEQADIAVLLRYVDRLYGRDNIEDETDFIEVRHEAIRQCRIGLERDHHRFITGRFFQSIRSNQ